MSNLYNIKHNLNDLLEHATILNKEIRNKRYTGLDASTRVSDVCVDTLKILSRVVELLEGEIHE